MCVVDVDVTSAVVCVIVAYDIDGGAHLPTAARVSVSVKLNEVCCSITFHKVTHLVACCQATGLVLESDSRATLSTRVLGFSAVF